MPYGMPRETEACPIGHGTLRCAGAHEGPFHLAQARRRRGETAQRRWGGPHGPCRLLVGNGGGNGVVLARSKALP